MSAPRLPALPSHAVRIAIAATVIALFACSPDLTGRERTGPRRLLLLGASNTFGIVTGEGDPYKTILASELGPDWKVVTRAFMGGRGVDWTPKSRPVLGTLRGEYGEDTPDVAAIDEQSGAILPFWDYAYPNLPADAVVLMVAVGDLIGPLDGKPMVTPARYGRAMREAVRGLLEHGAKRVILPVDTAVAFGIGTIQPNADAERLLEGYRQEILDIWELYRDSEAVHGGPLVVPGPDLLRTLDTDLHYQEPDPLHPNAAGHRHIADEYLAILRDLEAKGWL